MKTVKHFMLEYFDAKITDEKNYQISRLPFRQTFFLKNCRYDSHVDTLSRLESEKIVSIDEKDSSPKVITEQKVHYSGGERKMCLRYHLKRLDDKWFISDVQTACLVCEGRGDSKCSFCKGERWLKTSISP